MTYLTCCVNSTQELIHAMQASAEDVSLEDVREHCEGVDEWAKNMGYNDDFLLENDWHVAYCKSVYDGQPCFFIRHSGIEHIWV